MNFKNDLHQIKCSYCKTNVFFGWAQWLYLYSKSYIKYDYLFHIYIVDMIKKCPMLILVYCRLQQIAEAIYLFSVMHVFCPRKCWFPTSLSRIEVDIRRQFSDLFSLTIRCYWNGISVNKTKVFCKVFPTPCINNVLTDSVHFIGFFIRIASETVSD